MIENNEEALKKIANEIEHVQYMRSGLFSDTRKIESLEEEVWLFCNAWSIHEDIIKGLGKKIELLRLIVKAVRKNNDELREENKRLEEELKKCQNQNVS